MKTIRRERCVTHDEFGCEACRCRTVSKTPREANAARRAALQADVRTRDADLSLDEAQAILALYVRAGLDRVRDDDTDLLDLAEALGRKPNSIDMWVAQLAALDGQPGLRPVTPAILQVWAESRAG